jgi:hypothetical protein
MVVVVELIVAAVQALSTCVIIAITSVRRAPRMDSAWSASTLRVTVAQPRAIVNTLVLPA